LFVGIVSLGVCFLDGTTNRYVWYFMGVRSRCECDNRSPVRKRCASVISRQLQERVAKTLRQNEDAEKWNFGRCVVINGKISKWVDIECDIL
jgi:hypothetical protein